MSLGFLGSKYSRGPITLAVYSDGIDIPVEVMDLSLLEAGPGISTSVGMHEHHHFLRHSNLIDYDVPTAAALGYVIEWSRVGSLSDSFRLPAFRAGLTDPPADAQDIMRLYAGDQESEPVSAYDDGARLAGMALQLCGGTMEGGVHYIFGLSMGLSHKNAVELCWHSDAFSVVSSLRNGYYLYSDEDRLADESSRIGSKDDRAKLMEGVMALLKQKYRLAYLRKERLSAIGTADSKLAAWLARRRKEGLELRYRPAALAFQFYEDWNRNGKPIDPELKTPYSLGFNSADKFAETLLERESMEEPALRRDAAILAGLMKRLFENDSQAARRYTQMAVFGLSHVLSVAIARDEELFQLVCKLRNGGFSVLDRERLERDLASLDNASRAAVLRYVNQLDSEYEVRYVQPALNGRGLVPYDVHGACVSDAKTACLLNRFRVKVQWASITNFDTDFALVKTVSATSATFDVGGAAVTISVMDNGARGVNCRIIGGRSVHAYGIEIVDVKGKRTRGWQARAGEEWTTGEFLLSDPQ